jgi:hypothetical protein
VCKEADSRRHDVVCGFLASLAGAALDADGLEVVALVCAVLSLRALGDAKPRRLLEELSAGVGLSRSEERSIAATAKLVKRYAAKERGPFAAVATVATRDWISRMVQQEKSNAIGLQMPSGVSPPLRGAGLYPLLALANHSCLPNVAQVDNFSLAGSSNVGAPDERLRLSFRALRPLLAGAEVVQSYTNLGWPYFASVGACAQTAASVAAEQCPDCQAKLALRAELVRDGWHTDAPQGYHCDGCSSADPEYRCATMGCDFDLCAACFGGFVGRGEYCAARPGAFGRFSALNQFAVAVLHGRAGAKQPLRAALGPDSAGGVRLQLRLPALWRGSGCCCLHRRRFHGSRRGGCRGRGVPRGARSAAGVAARRGLSDALWLQPARLRRHDGPHSRCCNGRV